MNKLKTDAAKVASFLRNELKEKFPNVKFTVTSKSYTGGDSVTIKYTYEKGVTPTHDQVNILTFKYEAGKFDGMTDSYEYTNHTNAPTVKYVFVDVDYDNHIKSVSSKIASDYGITEDEQKDQYQYSKKLNESPYYFIRKKATSEYL